MQPIEPAPRPNVRELLANNLIFARARIRISQADLAAAAGVSRQTISEIERESANPTIDVIDRIAEALGVATDRLLLHEAEGLVDDDELLRRRESGRENFVDAFDALNAIEEAAGRMRRFSYAGRPRLETQL